MSFPVISGSTGSVQIGTGILYSNVVYFPPYSLTSGSSRTISWTVPPGVTTVRVRAWGGGGGSPTGQGTQYAGGGGGFALKTITNLPAGTVTVTIGSGGTSSNPGTGGNSSFGSYVSATGGKNAAGGATVTGGVGSGGDINMYGGGGIGGYGGNAGHLFAPFSGSNSDFSGGQGFPIITMANPTNPLDKIGTGYLFGAPVQALLMGNIPSTSASGISPGNGMGGGSGYNSAADINPGFPSGGSGLYYYSAGGYYNGTTGGAGLVVIEY